MKKKIIMPVGIVTCLSLVSASALSGCDNNSTAAVSVKNVVDFNWDIINSFYNALAKSFTDEKLKEQKDKGKTASDGETDNKPSSQADSSERVGNSSAVEDKQPSNGQAAFVSNNVPLSVIYDTVVSDSTFIQPEIVAATTPKSESEPSVAVSNSVTEKKNNIHTPVSAGKGKASVVVKNEVKDNKTKEEEKKEEETKEEEETGTILPSDDYSSDDTNQVVDHETEDTRESGSDHVHDWIPYDPDGEEPVEDPVEEPVVMAQTVYKEVIDNSRTTTYADDLGNVVCHLTSIGTIDTFEDGELVSSEGKEIAGSIEVHNLLTDEVSTFMPGELENPHDYVCNMFDQEVFPEGRIVGPSYGVYIEVFDNNYDSFYSDSLGNTICKVRIHDTIDKYENDVLVYSESEYEVGTVEIHNLVTDERFFFEPGTMDEYEEFVMEMFNGEAYYSGSLIGPAYGEPVDDDDYAYESGDESDPEYNDASEDYFICTICGEII